MSIKSWSTRDLEKKWGRELPKATSRSLPWELLNVLVSGLSEDTKLPRERFLQVISTCDVSGLFDLVSNLDVTEYTSADLLLQDRLVAELFSKFDFPDSPFNKREKAKFRFFEAEEICREANHRLKYSNGLENDVNSVLHAAIRSIQRNLGAFDLNAMLRYSRFGPGSSLCVGGPFTTEYFKLCEKCPTVSEDAFPYAEALLDFDDQWKAYLLGIHPFDVKGKFSPINGEGVEFRISNYNKVAFVPKNAKTERSIAIEPYFNVYFQLGIGGMLRKVLNESYGVNLDSQKRNQDLAREGSVSNELCTIDFSMASDTISVETVRLLLPPDWFNHLSRLRSRGYLMDGVVRPYHKFSSMGNGYTFELESLIFHTIALASCDALGVDTKNVTVFGDDVIIPVQAQALFSKVCNYLGFKVNHDKSFISGPFRESCGEDYLNGTRVRPVFCKELSTVQHVASLSNRLLELNRSVGFGSRINNVLCDAVSFLRSRIPRDVRKLVVGPPSEDMDGYLHTEEIELLAQSPLCRFNRSFACWDHPSIRFKAKKFVRRDGAAALWLTRSLHSQQRSIPRPFVHKPVKVHGHKVLDMTDFISERIPREITGRKIGTLTLG